MVQPPADPTGQAIVFTDEDGNETGHLFYDPLGLMIENATPGELREPLLAGGLEQDSGLQFDGQRYYDPWVGLYIQPGGGGVLGAPQSLNPFAPASGALPVSDSRGGIPPLLVDIGKSTVSNSIGAFLSDKAEPTLGVRWLEPAIGRLVRSSKPWYAVTVSKLPFAQSTAASARVLARFYQNEVHFLGPFRFRSTNLDEFGQTVATTFISRGLPEGAESFARGFGPHSQGFGYSIRWKPINFARPLSNFSLGLGVDFVLGGALQAYDDRDLWATNPGLAGRRVVAAGGENATYGAIGGLTAGVVYAGAVAFGIGTPPGWFLTGTAIVVATGAGITDELTGGHIHDFWFDGISGKIDDEILK